MATALSHVRPFALAFLVVTLTLAASVVTPVGEAKAQDAGSLQTDIDASKEKTEEPLNADLGDFSLAGKLIETGEDAYHLEGTLTPVTGDGQRTTSLKLMLVFYEGQKAVEKVYVKAQFNRNSKTYKVSSDFKVTKDFDSIGFQYWITVNDRDM